MSEAAAAAATAGEAPLVLLQGIDRRYRQGDATLEILKGAELAVWSGQSVALVAPSGAGKSTLLHIAGLLDECPAFERPVDPRAVAQMPDPGWQSFFFEEALAEIDFSQLEASPS